MLFQVAEEPGLVAGRERLGRGAVGRRRIVGRDLRRPAGKLRQQRGHLRLGAGLRVAIDRIQPGRGRVGQQLAQVGVEVGDVDAPRAGRAQVDDPIRPERPQVIGQMAGLQRLQQPAHQRGLAHPRAAHHGHQPAPVVAQEIRDDLVLDRAILEVARRDPRRRVDELRARPAREGAFGLALALQPGRDALLGAAGRGRRVGGDPFLVGDLPRQQLDVVLDARPVVVGGAAQVALRIGQAVTQRLQRARGRAQPIQVAAQLRQAGLEVAGEVNVLAAAQAERQFGVAVAQQRGDRLLVFEGARPFLLQVDASSTLSRSARRAGSRNRGSPRRAARPNRGPAPGGACPARQGARAARRSTVGQLQREVGAVNRGVADEVVLGHGWAFCVCGRVSGPSAHSVALSPMM